LVSKKACDAFFFIDLYPAIEGIRVSWLQHAVPRHGMRCLTGRNPEQGATPLADVGAGIMIAIVF
jgi:hypothetical protein